MKPSITDIIHFIYAAATDTTETVIKRGKTDKNIKMNTLGK
jgi:hypothetical protein